MRMTDLPSNPRRDLAASGLHEGHVRDAVRDHRDLLDADAIDRSQELPTFLRHDDEAGGSPCDLPDHGALLRARLCEHRVQRRDDRHVERGDQRQDLLAVLAAEDAEFVLQRDDVRRPPVEQVRGGGVGAGIVLVETEDHVRRIVVDLAGIVHRDDRGRHARPGERQGRTKVAGEGRDTTAARQRVSNENDTGKARHGRNLLVRMKDPPAVRGHHPERWLTITIGFQRGTIAEIEKFRDLF